MLDIAPTPVAVTPTAMLERVREVRAARRRAGCEELLLAVEWADAHPELSPSPHAERRSIRRAQDAGWMAASTPGADVEGARAWGEEELDAWVPGFDWASGASFAAALGTSTAAGERMIREALFLRHRMPRIWRQVQAHEIEAFRARRIAAALYARPADIVDHLDRVLEPIAATIGERGLEQRIDEAELLLDAEQRELEQLEALDAVGVELDEASIGHTGIATMQIRAEWKDLSDFDDAVAAVAKALAERARALDLPVESRDVRRAQALGWLADPARAAALLADPTASVETFRTASQGPGGRPSVIELVVHLTGDALLGPDPVATLDHAAVRTLLAQQVAAWCARPETDVRVRPVIDLTRHVRSSATTVTDVMALRAALAQPTCAFPHCHRRAVRCDKDHLVPTSEGGASCDCNLVPKCRHHHRLKTFAGWSYRRVGPTEYLWTEPHGMVFLRTGEATLDLTDHVSITLRDRPGWDGCSHDAPAA
ncbi:HNH endonuclease [Nocardioides rotundus]|uniref:HNH endonuclease signature motif containing protein n=1 Tax=Nocardioides rotundus TaxID=1774216 RepID=UPI001CBCF67B|nr:HNH endonuclease signature motif containing protein [Nocardioides rotundus]UAL29279.1 HNH endonuclease [Nocardioides rotundus]